MMALLSLGDAPPIDGDVSGVVASFKASRILCFASSRNERFETFLALPALSFVAAKDRLNILDRIVSANVQTEGDMAAVVNERRG